MILRNFIPASSPTRLWLAVIVSIASLLQSAQTLPAQESGAGIRKLRREWAFQQRAFPAGQIPLQALDRAAGQTLEAERAQQWDRSFGMAKSVRSDAIVPTTNSPTTPVASNWVNIGPAPIEGSQNALTNAYDPSLRVSGRISAIAVDPQNSNRWLVGTGQGGIWVTEDHGQTWSPKTDAMPSLAIGAIAFAPGAPDTVYAGTGESGGSDGYAGAGLIKSTDGGNTWSAVNDTSGSLVAVSFSEIRVSPSAPNTLLAATAVGAYGQDSLPSGRSNLGVLKSVDGGATWQKKLPPSGSAEASDIEVDSSNFNNQFAALSYPYGETGTGVYRSTDAGETWTLVNGPWTNTTNFPGGVGRIEMAISPADPNVLYVSIQDRTDPVTNPLTAANSNDNSLLGIWKTINALSPTPTWTQLPIPSGTKQMDYNHQLLVDPTDSRVLYFGEVRAWKYDGRPGASSLWTNITRNMHADNHAIAFAGDHLLYGNDGGIYYRDDRGVNISTTDWTSCNTNLAITQFYEGAVHPTDKNFALGGAQDNGTQQFVGNYGWNFVGYGDGGACAISKTNPNTNWLSSRYQLQILRSKTGGASGPDGFTRQESGIDDNVAAGAKNRAPFIARVVKHPTLDDVVLGGSDNIWRCNNFFSATTPTWSKNSPDEASGISAIAFAQNDPTGKIYAYATSGNASTSSPSVIKLTQNGGGTAWTDINASGGVPNRYVTNLAFAPDDANILYVTLSGFDENTPGKPGHLFRTKNALSASPTWTDISPPVNLPHNCIAIDYSHPEDIYVGTDLGVWQGETQSDGTVTWTHFGPDQGMPNVAVYDIKFQPPTRRLFAFTHGRAAFVADLFPANDNLASARVITGTSGRVVDTNINASLEAGEPDHYIPTPEKGQHSVWFLWIAPISGQAVFDTIDSNFDTDLAVYNPGSDWNQVALPALASDNNSGGNGTSRLTFQATAGNYYFIAINGSAASDTGFYALNWSISDSTLPQVAITSPTHRANVSSLAAISGTASDASGIQSNEVKLKLQYVSTGEYWNGTSWTYTPAILTASLSGGTWTYSSVPTGSDLRSGDYAVSADVQDNAGNFSAPQAGVNRTNFTVDSTPPLIAITKPAPYSTINGLINIKGTASDLIGRPNLYIIRYADGAYWTASGWASGATAILPTNYDAGTKTWVNSGPLPQVGANDPNFALTDGSYDLVAFAYDAANNQTRTDSVIYVDTTGSPAVTVTTPAPGSTINALPSVSGTASPVIQIVSLFITRYSDGKWWNGSQWVNGAFELPTNYDAVAHTWRNATNLPDTSNGPATSLASGSYDIFALAYDGRGGTPVRHDSVVTVDRSLVPTVHIDSPVNGQTIHYLSTITGTASSIADGVNLYLYRYSDGKFWDGTAWGGGGSAILPISYDRTAGTWFSTGQLPYGGSDPNTSLTGGSYDVIAIAFDSAGNQARNDSVVTVDNTGPALVSLQFLPDAVDVSTQSQSVTATVRVTDPSGFNYGSVTLRSPSGNREFTTFISDYNRISGNSFDGTYSVPLFLSRYIEPGIWHATLFFTDEIYNYSSYGQVGDPPLPAGSPGTVTVTNTAGVDNEDPALVSLTLSPASVDVSSATRPVTVTVVATDDFAGLKSGSVQFSSPSGAGYLPFDFSSANLVSGTSTNGTYSFTINVPRFIEPGTWSVSLSLFDNSDRSVYYGQYGMAFPAGSNTELIVTNTVGVDAEYPVMSGLQISPSSVDVTTAAQTVNISFQVTDDVAGLDNGYFMLTSPSGRHQVGTSFDAAQRTAGSALAGTYGLSLTIPRYSEPGTWTASMYVYDASGKVTSYGGYNGSPLPQTLAVINTGAVDLTAPLLTSMSFSPIRVNVGNSSQQVTITVQISDPLSGYSGGEVAFYPPGAQPYSGTPTTIHAAQRISGDENNGTYQAVFTIPKNAPEGDWKIGLALVDNTGNWRYYGAGYYYSQPLPYGINDTLTVAHDNNTRPVVNAGPGIAATVGGNVTFSGSFTDPDVGDTHAISWTFGDGGTAFDTLTPTHVYAYDGIFTVVLTVTDSSGASGSATLVVTVNLPPPTYTDWTGSAFPPGTLESAKADTADPDGDGVSNLLEYAFNMNPGSNSLDGLPSLGTMTDTPGLSPSSPDAADTPSHLTLSYNRRIGSTDLVYIVAVSDDLVTWDKTQAQIETVGAPVPLGDGQTERVTVRYNTPMSSTAKKFLRVEVERQ